MSVLFFDLIKKEHNGALFQPFWPEIIPGNYRRNRKSRELIFKLPEQALSTPPVEDTNY